MIAVVILLGGALVCAVAGLTLLWIVNDQDRVDRVIRWLDARNARREAVRDLKARVRAQRDAARGWDR